MLKKYRIFVLENPQEICWLLSYWPILIPILFSSKIKYVSIDIKTLQYAPQEMERQMKNSDEISSFEVPFLAVHTVIFSFFWNGLNCHGRDLLNTTPY